MSDPTTEAGKRLLRCYANRWHPSLPRCDERAIWVSSGLGNIVDGWAWCLRHAPSEAYRIIPDAALAKPEESTE